MKKNWIKKAGAAVLGLILTGSLLAGCGSGSSTTAQGADEPQAQETEACKFWPAVIRSRKRFVLHLQRTQLIFWKPCPRSI